MTTADRQRIRGQLEELHNKEFAGICFGFQMTFGPAQPTPIGRDEWMRYMLADRKLDYGCSRSMRDARLLDFFRKEGIK